MASPRPFTSADRPPPQYDDDDSWDDDEKFLFDTFVRAWALGVGWAGCSLGW